MSSSVHLSDPHTLTQQMSFSPAFTNGSQTKKRGIMPSFNRPYGLSPLSAEGRLRRIFS